MDEVDNLLISLINCSTARRISYHDLFKTYLKLDPHTIHLKIIHSTLKKCGINLHSLNTIISKDEGLQLLLDFIIQEYIDPNIPLFVYDFPCFPSSASIHSTGPYSNQQSG